MPKQAYSGIPLTVQVMDRDPRQYKAGISTETGKGKKENNRESNIGAGSE